MTRFRLLASFVLTNSCLNYLSVACLYRLIQQSFAFARIVCFNKQLSQLFVCCLLVSFDPTIVCSHHLLTYICVCPCSYELGTYVGVLGEKDEIWYAKLLSPIVIESPTDTVEIIWLELIANDSIGTARQTQKSCERL